MSPYTINLLPSALDDIAERHRYLSYHAGKIFADRYIDHLEKFLSSFSTIPNIGQARRDITPMMRTIGYKKHAVIAFEVDNDHEQINVIGILFGRQLLERRFL
jgi:toxin ParE1/3/4